MKKENPSKKRRSYDAEFKANILKMNADGRSVSSLSESFGINENLIYRWKRASSILSDKTAKVGINELLELKAENKRLKIERDILKKALSIFSRPVSQ
ncbi:MAG: transposase [Saprospiraceae bacterium]